MRKWWPICVRYKDKQLLRNYSIHEECDMYIYIYIHVQEQSISKFGKLYWLLGVYFNFKIYDEFWKEVERWNNNILSKLKERELNKGNEIGYSYLEADIKKIYDKMNGNIICYEYNIWKRNFTNGN